MSIHIPSIVPQSSPISGALKVGQTGCSTKRTQSHLMRKLKKINVLLVSEIQSFYIYIHRVYQNSMAKLQEWIPHIERRKKGYENMGREMYGYRVVRAYIY
jgi:hypothetical protein